MHAEGACGFGDLHKTSYGKYSTGLSGMLFNRGSSCGACFEVRCADNMLWCQQRSPSIVLSATDFCPPNYGVPADYGGWCNFPRAHFQMPEAAFSLIAQQKADIVSV
ncbi:UNVERIFIED_CONTAM: Expansin-A20 [Sesamum latifolium]|uniref:Expansin n=1 Tax=Sesamum latifolium TaxID=2727402 RepID=A0AAW2V252_9LAMI